jgi:hypothetical protein
MKYLLLFAALALGPTLAGCETMSPQEAQVSEENQCTGYGFHPGTDAYSQCMLQLDQNRAANDREQNAQFRAYLKAAALGMAASQPKPPTTCTTVVNGNVWGQTYNQVGSTTCF